MKFFPEGGALLSIPHQNVAFKAQGADGFSKDIEGFLFNSKGDTLTNFRSEHNGMGVFTMNPIDNETYYITAKTNDSITKRFDLPAVEPKGISIAMSHYKQEIRFEVQRQKLPNGLRSYSCLRIPVANFPFYNPSLRKGLSER